VTGGAKNWVREQVHAWFTRRRIPRRLPWSHWGYTAHDDGMSLHGASLDSLAREFGSPLHVLNVPRLLANLDAFLAGSRTITPTVCCSVKTYPVPGMLALLVEHGAQAEVISEHEVWMARQLGLSAAQVIYNGPAKSDASLEWAVLHGIKAIHLNHREELQRVAAIARRLDRRVRVGFRVTGSGVAGQFGLPMDDPATIDVIREALQEPHVELVSLHGHRGYYMRTAVDVSSHIEPMLAFARQLRDVLRWECAMLDVGGALAVPSVAPLAGRSGRLARTFGVPADAPDLDATLTPARYSALVCDRVAEYCAQHAMPVPEVVMEPGRALSADAQALLSTVLELRTDHPLSYAVTDAGTAVAPGACHEYHQMGVAHRTMTAETRRLVYRIVGPICHLGDVASLAWELPVLARGDRLVMMDTGAYFISDASSFSFGQPGVVAVFADGTTRLLRRTETSDDMVRRDVWA
jgi:diaminopimelate decarboxylase